MRPGPVPDFKDELLQGGAVLSRPAVARLSGGGQDRPKRCARYSMVAMRLKVSSSSTRSTAK